MPMLSIYTASEIFDFYLSYISLILENFKRFLRENETSVPDSSLGELKVISPVQKTEHFATKRTKYFLS